MSTTTQRFIAVGNETAELCLADVQAETTSWLHARQGSAMFDMTAFLMVCSFAHECKMQPACLDMLQEQSREKTLTRHVSGRLLPAEHTDKFCTSCAPQAGGCWALPGAYDRFPRASRSSTDIFCLKAAAAFSAWYVGAFSPHWLVCMTRVFIRRATRCCSFALKIDETGVCRHIRVSLGTRQCWPGCDLALGRRSGGAPVLLSLVVRWLRVGSPLCDAHSLQTWKQ